METILGIPVVAVMQVLLGVVCILLLAFAILSMRSRVIATMAVRNLARRRLRTGLILLGLALSTVIITSAMGTGDTIAFSIRRQAIDNLGEIDQVITSAANPSKVIAADVTARFQTSLFFDEALYEALREEVTSEAEIDGLAPAIRYSVSLINQVSGQGEPGCILFAPGPEYDHEFGGLCAADGARVKVDTLGAGEAYLNQAAADRLLAHAGDVVQMSTGAETVSLRVHQVVANHGLHSTEPVIVVPLREAQQLLGAPAEITEILVSDRGDAFEGIEHSRAATERLRVLLVDVTVATDIAGLLRTPAGGAALATGEEGIRSQQERLARQVADLRRELAQPYVSNRLVALVADPDLNRWLMALDLTAAERARLGDLLSAASVLSVEETKAAALEEADTLGIFSTSIFMGLGTFALLAGVLLIFMIFVMLATERRSEMGLTRALGTQRHQLVQMLATEGMLYALLAGIIGVGAGVGISYLMVGTISGALGSFAGPGEELPITFHLSACSLVISFCLGIVTTFFAVTVSSWHVSRLNIVTAIRDLPAEEERERAGCLYRLYYAAFGPWLLSVSAPFLIMGYRLEQKAMALLGYTIAILGAGFTLRWILGRTRLDAPARNRVSFVAIGLALLLFWATPFTVRDPLLGIGGMATGVEIFVISGISLIAGAIWLVVYTADLFLPRVNLLLGKLGGLAPIVRIATAYPLSARFRTGMALAMFALVLFTIIIISALVEMGGRSFADVESLTGGFDVEATISSALPAADLGEAMQHRADVPADQIRAVGTVSELLIQVRQEGSEEQIWESYRLVGYDEAYVRQVQSHFGFTLRAPGYDSDEAVWQALQARDDVVIVGGLEVPYRQQAQYADNIPGFWLEGVYQEQASLPDVVLEIRSPATGRVQRFHVIGVLEWGTSIVGAVQASRQVAQALSDRPLYPSIYFVDVRDGGSPEAVARSLESAFLQQGMNAIALEQSVRGAQAGNRGIARLLRGFLALGLVVGTAALGVISARTVVERRRQIGMLRAIGYERHMVALSLLFESSLVALLGITAGVLLGTVTSWNMAADYYQNQPGMAYEMPWLQVVGVVLFAYLVSQLSTIVPAVQAARIYPADALRYE